MSRINDALRRARQAQKYAPRTPPPAVRIAPVHQAQQRQSDFSMPLILALAGVLVLAGMLISFALFRHTRDKGTTGISTRIEARAAVTTPEPPPSTATPTPPQPAVDLQQVDFAAAPPSLAPLPMVTTTPTPEAPSPTLPVLQGIFYRPDRPTAIINGKSVRPGATVGEFQVLAISFDTVTVGNATQTNVLRLAE